MNKQTAHIDFIRRAPSGEGNQRLGYFIEVPLGTLVTVNGITYTNNDDSSPAPFFIGPLDSYAVIELLSQPVFFFRNEESLKHSVTTRKAPQDEIDRRDLNGDVAPENVRVRWLQLGSPTLMVEAEPEEENEGHDLEQSEEGANEPAEELYVEEDAFSDAFTDDGNPIENPHVYIQSCLRLHMEERLDTLIPRVIASVNQRQPENTGFSFLHDNMVLRQGRTLLTGVTQAETRILLIGEVQPDNNIRIRILDPMTWRTTESRRKTIFTQLQQWLLTTNWWKNAFKSNEEMGEHMPQSFEGVPCAQTTTQEGAFTYTVLNAWALAMGLEPNPTFRPSSHSNEAFFIQAQQLFDLALQDQLTWKMLFAFLSNTGFVKPLVALESEDNANAQIPAKNRRFDQRKRSFTQLIADQNEADVSFPAKEIEIQHMPLGLEEGKSHREAFPSDCLTEEERDRVAPFVRDGQWSFHGTVEQPKQRFEQEQQNAEPDIASTSTLSDPPSSPPQLDPFPIPENFNPCAYLEAEIKRLVDLDTSSTTEQSESTDVPRLSKQEIQDSIAAVIRAINLRHPPGAGFTIEVGNTHVESSTDINGDLLALTVMEASDMHELCILIQNPTGGQTPFYTVIDSAPWATDKAKRAEIRDTLNETFPITEPVPWVFAPQQAQAHHSGHHVVLNAWSIVLGLPLNLQDFTSSLDFIRAAHHIIKAVLRGDADWLLIWALLCYYGYVESAEAPEVGRRFSRTVPSSEHEAYQAEMNTKKAGSATGAEINTYSHFKHTSTQEHNANFHWDDLTPDDRNVGIPELQRNGLFRSALPREELRMRYRELRGKFDACHHLRQSLNHIRVNATILSELRQFRNEGATTNIGDWLLDIEVALSISAVLLAINDVQDAESGFSIVPQNYIQACAFTDDPNLTQFHPPALRPGRPLIAPIHHRNHFVLLVAQFNEEGRPTISILDSQTHQYEQQNREEVFQMAWRVLCRTSWWRGFFPDVDAFNQVKPASASWIKTAQQPGSSECGYYVILNAWALALGLELNPDVRLQWTHQFHRELLDVMHLARLARVDSRLIFAFLRCHNIVRDGVIPHNRRFSRTHQTRGEAVLDRELENRCALEKTHWTEQNYGPEALARMKSSNRVPGMNGVAHNEPKAFASDKWSPESKQKYVQKLQDSGMLNMDHDEQQLKEAYDNMMKSLLENIWTGLAAKTSSPKRQNLVRALRHYIDVQFENMDEDTENDPTSWIEDTICFFEHVRKNKLLRKCLGRIGFSGQQNWQRPLGNDELNFAIVSVLEAIDGFQSGEYRDTGCDLPFAGGFALTTSANLQMALDPSFGNETGDLFSNMAFSRPRRAWLIPLVVGRDGLLAHLEQWAIVNNKKWNGPKDGAGGHSLLILVQEVPNSGNTRETHFEIHAFDSSIRVFEEVRDFLRERIEQAAHRLGWSTHRNGPDGPQFDGQLHLSESIAQQPKGGWQCGHHVLINAWIIALGLHPNDEAKFNNEIYSQLHTLAQAATSGILDWTTLAGWLISHELVIEDQLEYVPEERRFNFTVGQTDEFALDRRIRTFRMPVDQRLASISVSESRYDHDNNYYDYFGDDTEDTESDSGLDRCIDDADEDFLNGPRGAKRKRSKHSDYGLEFLDQYDSGCADGRGDEGYDARAGKRRRGADRLSFLDVYCSEV